MEKLYSPEQVAEILSLSGDTIRRWLKEGRVKGVKVAGRAWRIKESELNRLLEENNHEGGGE